MKGPRPRPRPFHFRDNVRFIYCLSAVDHIGRNAESGDREHEDQTGIKDIIVLDAYQRCCLTSSHNSYLNKTARNELYCLTRRSIAKSIILQNAFDKFFCSEK